MHGRTAQPRKSHEEGCQLGTCSPYCDHVLACDDTRHDDPLHPIQFLYRWPRIHWYRRRCTPWANWIPTSRSPQAIDIVPTVMLILTNWLADGLLVSRILNSLLQVFEVGRPPCSCIVAL